MIIGVVTKAQESKFKADMSSYNEKVKMYKLSEEIKKTDTNTINAGLDGNVLELTEIISDFDEKSYGGKVVVRRGEMYYFAPEKRKRSKQIKREIKWCEEIGISIYTGVVELYDDYDEVEPLNSRWVTVNGISYYSPDISKFNKKNTYYVDSTGVITARIDREEEPTNWYDYKEKLWANIVTVSGNSTSYWVWIPRYEYKIALDEQGNKTQKTDVKFITTERTNTGTTPETRPDEGYEIPECFTFNGKELNGYWLSKYEMSSTDNGGFKIDVGTNSATIEALSVGGEYRIFLDGKFLAKSELPFVLNTLKQDIMYNVMIVGPNGTPIGDQNIVLIKEEIEPPDLSKLNLKNTYYIDSDGKVAGRADRISEPENWYDYGNKKWANIATTGAESVTYWVWIPRYEYQIVGGNKTKVKFIPKTQTKANEGYEIPECFEFGGKQLSGYWLSKYEMSVNGTEVLDFEIGTTIEVKAKTSDDTNEYVLYIDGNLYNNGEHYSLPHLIEGLESGKTYNILITKADTGQIVLERDIATWTNNVEPPDLSNLEDDCTYYLTWDSSGNEIRTPITQNAPEGWYNYNNKKWANIVTTGKSGDVEAYWVWIPRYEYKVYGGTGKTTVKFIKQTQKIPDEGYEIPESFTFNGKDLKGYWLSKYEVSNTN